MKYNYVKIKMQHNYAHMRLIYVDIIMLHVDINKSHVHILRIMLRVNVR